MMSAYGFSFKSCMISASENLIYTKCIAQHYNSVMDHDLASNWIKVQR